MVVAPVSLLPVTVTVAVFSVLLMRSSVAILLITGAVGATVSTLMLRVVVLALPAASVDIAVKVSAPSPNAVIAAAFRMWLQVVAVTWVTALPLKVVVAPVSLLPVTVTVAVFSVLLIRSSVAILLITGAVGATVSTLMLRVVAVLALPAASVDIAVKVSAPSPNAVIAAAFNT